MQSTLKQPDDPHDILQEILEVAPDAVRTVPADDELSKVLRVAARCLSDSQLNAAPEVRAETPAAPLVPTVDTTFRPTAANDDIRLSGHRPSGSGRALRGFAAVLLTAGMCAAGIAWHASGDAAKKLVAKWGTQILMMSPLAGSPAQPAEPDVEADAVDSATSQPASPAQAAAEVATPAAASDDQAQLVQSLRNDVASLGQEVVQLKATIEKLRAGQQQASRDVAKVTEKVPDAASEPNLKPKKPLSPPSALPRSAAAPVRKPMPVLPPSRDPALPQNAGSYLSQAAPYPPQAAPPYPPPPATTQTLADPELASVPRPPMPLSR